MAAAPWLSTRAGSTAGTATAARRDGLVGIIVATGDEHRLQDQKAK
jgi:hypothetical protein